MVFQMWQIFQRGNNREEHGKKNARALAFLANDSNV